jgi:hypothetical protein
MQTNLLHDIDDFLASTGMGEYRFGILAARNGRLLERLRAGTTPKGRPVRVWPDTEAQIRSFMDVERVRRVAKEPAEMVRERTQ